MFSKSILLLSVVALVLAEPNPQADVSSELASAASVLASVLSGAPTLPSFVESVFKTAIPLSAFPMAPAAKQQHQHGIILCQPTSRALFPATTLRSKAGILNTPAYLRAIPR